MKVKDFTKWDAFIIVLAMLSLIAVAGCATNPLEQRKARVIACVSELRGTDAETMEAFEVCRQVYRLKKVKD